VGGVAVDAAQDIHDVDERGDVHNPAGLHRRAGAAPALSLHIPERLQSVKMILVQLGPRGVAA
jgi:hypothetical protein